MTGHGFIAYEGIFHQKHLKDVFMLSKSLDTVSIVADRGVHLLVAD